MSEVNDADGCAARGACEAGVTRREFCGSVAAASAVILVGPAASLAAASAREHGPGAFLAAKRIDGAEFLMPGDSLNFRYPTEADPAVLVRGPEGNYYAYSQKCTHLSCPVHYERGQGRILCPCHGGSYDLRTGAVLAGPPRHPLARIELEVRSNGEVWAVGRRGGNEPRLFGDPQS